MSYISWSDDPLTNENNTLATYIQELQQNCNYVREIAGLGQCQWRDASAEQKFYLEHLEEIKRVLEDWALLKSYSYNSIEDILGHPWSAYPQNVKTYQKLAGYQIINDMRRVIDNLERIIYGVDDVDGRIIKVAMNGGSWATYGKHVVGGLGKGEFSNPHGIYYDKTSKRVYVADWTNHRIVRTKMDGSEWATYGTLGEGVGQFWTPYGIYYDEDSKYIYVTNYGKASIVKTKWGGAGWTRYGSTGSGVGEFSTPAQICYDENSEYLYIADPGNNRIVKTKIDGSGWTTYGSTGSGVGEFSNPYGIWYDNEDDYIYIADKDNNRIVKTKIDGSGWTTYGSTGSGVGEFDVPFDLCYRKLTKDIYIADKKNYRIVKTKIDGSGWASVKSQDSIPIKLLGIHIN